VCQQSSSQGNTGIACIKLKNSSGTLKWPEIRWMKFGFTRHFNPVLWLANDSQSERLQELFERARQSRSQSLEHKKAMEEDLIDIDEEVLDKQLHYEWPEGRAIVKVDGEEGLHQFVIDKLDLKISVQLVPFCSPTIVTTGITDGSGLPLRPMIIWVVDITETTHARGEIRPLSADRITYGAHCLDCLDRSFCVGFELLSCLSCLQPCRLKMTLDEYWYFHREETRAKKEEEEAKHRKQLYESDAHSRVPFLITSEVKQ
jgi:hypothetical protein